MATLPPNLYRLLRALIEDGPTFRAELARALDISRTTVTNLVNQLEDMGLVEEEGRADGSLKNGISITANLGIVAAVVFHISRCTLAIALPDGRILATDSVSLDLDQPAEERTTEGVQLLDKILDERQLRDKLRAIHLAVDTQIDVRQGRVYSSLASARWRAANPKKIFQDAFGVDVYVQNTARLRGLAEYKWGAGQNYDDVYYIELSEGVTSAHITDGIIHSGFHGGAGELGHTVFDWNGPQCECGNRGCLQQYVSVPALVRDLKIVEPTVQDFEDVQRLVREGDSRALDILDRVGEILGRTLVNLANLHDPEAIVIAGEISELDPSILRSIEQMLCARTLPLVGENIRVVAGQLTDPHSMTVRAGVESLHLNERVIDQVLDF
ncbi:MAG: ROK family transcriptional regulator [Actinomycetaceae bacterium]|nr:ROK family transcriptional regulator [Actinomycetaceae bacterium]